MVVIAGHSHFTKRSGVFLFLSSHKSNRSQNHAVLVVKSIFAAKVELVIQRTVI